MKLKKILITFTLLSIVNANQWDGRCDLRETVNITGGYNDDKGNYLFNGVLYSPGNFATINFVLNRVGEKIPTSQHVRGCICLNKPCIRFCCEDDSCIKNSSFSLPSEGNSETLIDLSKGDYGALMGWPCKELYKLEPLQFHMDEWLFLKVSAV